MVKEHIETFGKLPEEWWERWDARAKWFTEDERRNDPSGCVRRSLAGRFEDSVYIPRWESEMEGVGGEGRTALLEFSREILVFSPEERIDIAGVM